MKKVRINYKNIPKEMREMDRWACFDVSDGKKKPYTPGTDDHARPNDVSTLRSFEEAVEEVRSGRRDHIAFCFMDDDVWVFLDLDHTDDEEYRKEHLELLQWFPSYTERSVSGKGAHIIIKGKLDGNGLAEEHIQISDKNRFCIMTGDLIKKRGKIRIGNTQKLKLLQDKIRKSRNQGFTFPLEEHEWDFQNVHLFYTACVTVYQQKFINLFNGDWTQYSEYHDKAGRADHSRADHALISMMCELSESNALVRYAFGLSGLFRDDKGGGRPETYIDRTIQKYRDKVMNEAIRLERSKELADEARIAEEKREAKAKKKVSKKTTKKKTSKKKTSKPATGKKVIKQSLEDKITSVSFDHLSDDELMTDAEIEEYDFTTEKIDKIPSRLHRMLAEYFLKNARSPNEDIAIVCANVVVTMIKQRAYVTPTNTGLNLSWWLIAETGKGKDIFSKCLDLVVSELQTDVPHLNERIVGKFASGEAMETVLSKHPLFMSKVPEAGAWWRKVISPNRPPHIDALNEGILNLTMATDYPHGMWRCRKKVKQDEELKSSIFRAAGSFYGESTFADMFADMDVHSIGTGLLQRQIFVCLEDIPFVEQNSGKHPMSDELKDLLIDHITKADDLDLTESVVKVRATKRAYAKMTHIERELRLSSYNQTSGDLENDYLNRTSLKIWRHATQLATGDRLEKPFINEAQVDYAYAYIMGKDKYMLNKFKSGDVGKGQLKQEADMLRIIRAICSASPVKRRKTYKFPEHVAQDKNILTFSRLSNEARQRSSFRSDPKGTITAIENCIDSLCKGGVLSRLTKVDAMDRYDTNANLLQYNRV